MSADLIVVTPPQGPPKAPFATPPGIGDISPRGLDASPYPSQFLDVPGMEGAI